MSTITHSARVTGPIQFVGPDGLCDTIPLGPCLVEQLEGQLVDIVWGQSGEESTVLPMKDVETAELAGKLVLLD